MFFFRIKVAHPYTMHGKPLVSKGEVGLLEG
jgi:hypothetical protein